MANPTITNYGVIPYVNNTNNWREKMLLSSASARYCGSRLRPT